MYRGGNRCTNADQVRDGRLRGSHKRAGLVTDDGQHVPDTDVLGAVIRDQRRGAEPFTVSVKNFPDKFAPHGRPSRRRAWSSGSSGRSPTALSTWKTTVRDPAKRADLTREWRRSVRRVLRAHRARRAGDSSQEEQVSCAMLQVPRLPGSTAGQHDRARHRHVLLPPVRLE